MDSKKLSKLVSDVTFHAEEQGYLRARLSPAPEYRDTKMLKEALKARLSEEVDARKALFHEIGRQVERERNHG